MKKLIFAMTLGLLAAELMANPCYLNLSRGPEAVNQMVSGVQFKNFTSVEKAMKMLKGSRFEGVFYSYRFSPMPVSFEFSSQVDGDRLEYSFARKLSSAQLRRGCLFGKTEVRRLGKNEDRYTAQNGALPKRTLVLQSVERGYVDGNVIDGNLHPVQAEFDLLNLSYGKKNGNLYLRFDVLWDSPLSGNVIKLNYVVKTTKSVSPRPPKN